jgi:hypothetical protein
MKRSGRVHILVVLAVVAVVVFGFLIFFSGSGPTQTASDFLIALAKGDVDKLTELSYPDEPQDKMHAEWANSVEQAKYYRFIYRLVNTESASDDQASVNIKLEPNIGQPEDHQYMQDFGIPLKKYNGQWKVLSKQLPRDMYPFLP